MVCKRNGVGVVHRVGGDVCVDVDVFVMMLLLLLFDVAFVSLYVGVCVQQHRPQQQHQRYR